MIIEQLEEQPLKIVIVVIVMIIEQLEEQPLKIVIVVKSQATANSVCINFCI